MILLGLSFWAAAIARVIVMNSSSLDFQPDDSTTMTLLALGFVLMVAGAFV